MKEVFCKVGPFKNKKMYAALKRRTIPIETKDMFEFKDGRKEKWGYEHSVRTVLRAIKKAEKKGKVLKE